MLIFSIPPYFSVNFILDRDNMDFKHFRRFVTYMSLTNHSSRNQKLSDNVPFTRDLIIKFSGIYDRKTRTNFATFASILLF
jgi:hypothetical protein